MGEPNNIEDKLRDKLNTREFVVKDSWQDDMDAKLDVFNSQKKGGFIFWISGTLGMLILAGIIIYSVGGHNEAMAEYSPRLQMDESSPLRKENQTKESQKERILEAEKGSLTSENFILNNKFDKDKLKSEIELQQKNSENEKGNIAETSVKEGISLISKSGAAALDVDRSKSIADKTLNIDSSKKSDLQVDEILKEISLGKENKDPLDFSEDNGETTFMDNKNFGNSRNHLGNELDVSLEKNNDHLSIFALENDNMRLTRMNRINFLLAESAIKDASILKKNTLELIIPSLRSKWNVSLNAGITSSILNEDSFLKSLSSFNGILEVKPLNSIQLDFRIGKQIGENLELTSGISSTSYGEELTYLDHFKLNSTSSFEFIETEILQIDSTFIDSILFIDSVLVTIIDTMEVIMIDSTFTELDSDANGKRKYSYLEIPLGFTYHLNVSNRSSILVSPELAFGILTKNSGEYYKETLVSAQTKTLIIGSSFGVGYKLRLTRDLDFRTMVRVRKPLGNLNLNDDFNRKYWSYSITAGIGYMF